MQETAAKRAYKTSSFSLSDISLTSYQRKVTSDCVCRAMLVAAAKQAGAEVGDLGIARDTEGHTQACLEKAISQQVDVLVTTGRASCCIVAALLHHCHESAFKMADS